MSITLDMQGQRWLPWEITEVSYQSVSYLAKLLDSWLVRCHKDHLRIQRDCSSTLQQQEEETDFDINYCTRFYISWYWCIYCCGTNNKVMLYDYPLKNHCQWQNSQVRIQTQWQACTATTILLREKHTLKETDTLQTDTKIMYCVLFVFFF